MHRWFFTALALGVLVLAASPAQAQGSPEAEAQHQLRPHMPAESTHEGVSPEGGRAEDAHHEGDHHPAFSGKTFAFQLINFAIFVFILIKFGGGAANKALRVRHDQMKKDLEEAAHLRRAAEERLKEQEQRLVNLEHELSALRGSLKTLHEAERGNLLAAATDRSRRIQAETQFLLDQQIKEAEGRFRQEISDAAIQVAEELLRRSVGAADEQRLAATFVADVERGPAPRSHEWPH